MHWKKINNLAIQLQVRKYFYFFFCLFCPGFELIPDVVLAGQGDKIDEEKPLTVGQQRAAWRQGKAVLSLNGICNLS